MTEQDELLDDWNGDMSVFVKLGEWNAERYVDVVRGNVVVAHGTADEWDLAIAYANFIVEHPEWTSWLATEDWKNEPWDLIFETIEGHEPWLSDELYAKYLPDSPERAWCEPCFEYYEKIEDKERHEH